MINVNNCYLISIPCKTAAFHSTRIIISRMIKLEQWQRRLEVVEYRRESAPKSDQPLAVPADAHTHATLSAHTPSITHQAATKHQAVMCMKDICVINFNAWVQL